MRTDLYIGAICYFFNKPFVKKSARHVSISHLVVKKLTNLAKQKGREPLASSSMLSIILPTAGCKEKAAQNVYILSRFFPRFLYILMNLVLLRGKKGIPSFFGPPPPLSAVRSKAGDQPSRPVSQFAAGIYTIGRKMAGSILPAPWKLRFPGDPFHLPRAE